MKLLATALLATVLGSGSSALAQNLDLPGPYGTPEGCEVVEDQNNDPILSTGVSVLTAERFRAGDVDCRILQTLGNGAPDFVTTMLCNRQSEQRTTIDLFRLTKIADADAWEMADATGKVLGRLDRCE